MSPQEIELAKMGMQALLSVTALAYVAVKGGHWWMYQRNGTSPEAKQVKLLERIAGDIGGHRIESAHRNELLNTNVAELKEIEQQNHDLLVKLEDRG